MQRTRTGIGLAAALALVATALLVTLSGGAATAAEVPAAIQDYEYAPGDVSITAGDTVTWTNGDRAPHTVTSEGSGPLDSPNMQQGDSWSFTFTQPGTYPYYCLIHPDMKGSVTVTAPPTTHPPSHTPTTETPTTAAPPTTDAPPTTEVPPPAEGAPDCNESGALAGVVDPFWAHFQAAHLETSVGQQVADALSVDDYVLAHTILVEQMLQPIFGLLGGGGVLDPFWAHLQAAHLETSVGQQVADALAVDDYVLAHTILVEQMLAPAMGGTTGTAAEC